MSEVFTETSSQSWFSRIGNSFKSLLFGGLIFVVAFPVLFWNEGRAVTTARSLDEGQKLVVPIDVEVKEGANEGKLIHATGRAATEETLRDELFSIEANAIRLNRVVEMYQWEEIEETENKKRVGGSMEKVTTYRYQPVWSTDRIDSTSFRQSDGHRNPTSMPIAGQEWTAAEVRLGEFVLSDPLVRQIKGAETVPADDQHIPEQYREKMRLAGGELYLGKQPDSPEIGDLRIRFTSTPASDVSILAKQTGDTFSAYATEAGDSLNRLELGRYTAEEMFDHARSENTALTWILRAVGCGLMFGGLVMLMSPLAVLGDVVPLIGSIVQGGTFLVAGAICLIFAPLTIAVAWMFYRPLIAVPLLLVSFGAFAFLVMQRRKTGSAVPAN